MTPQQIQMKCSNCLVSWFEKSVLCDQFEGIDEHLIGLARGPSWIVQCYKGPRVLLLLPPPTLCTRRAPVTAPPFFGRKSGKAWVFSPFSLVLEPRNPPPLCWKSRFCSVSPSCPSAAMWVCRRPPPQIRQLRPCLLNSGFDHSVTVALGLAFCSVRVRGISLFSGIEHDWNEIVFITLSRACLFEID
ncbi:hypothetical protein SLEP1_g37174 [Rubroshorea leprosula]|uniref:Uncharacterized protein n=1 Tax=Rubroshorea leprosula TaxID=152421 RepID=A0AAV5KTX7_9ROSI|nr:hypothetical protein SLEP1_g37174 [Rubroshorea leprosula]